MMTSRSTTRASVRLCAAASAVMLLAASAGAAPIITSVSGCVDDSSSTTSECPTAGAVAITIRGEAFGASGAHAYVGGSNCAITDQSDQQLVCTLPPGSGADVDVVVSDDSSSASLPVRVLTYSPPLITSVSGCTNGSDGTTSECARTGNVPITIQGQNFGPSGSSKIVMFGGQSSSSIVSDDDTSIVATLPPGTGAGKSVLVLASNQLSAGSSYTFSYAQCAAGTRLDAATGACTSCPAGEFSSSSDASSCSSCPDGTVSSAGSSSCTGASAMQCWSAKDVSADKFTKIESLSISDEVAANGTVEVKKPAMYCTGADVSNSGVPAPDIQQCCYQVKGDKLATAKQAVVHDEVGGDRDLSISMPKMVCMSCTATFP